MKTFRTDRAIAGTSAILMDRIVKSDGTAIVQADVSSISLSIVKLPNGTPAVTAPSKVTLIYDTLQTAALNPIWKRDSTGFNFKYDAGGSEIADADAEYEYTFTLTMVTGNPIGVRFVVPTV